MYDFVWMVKISHGIWRFFTHPINILSFPKPSQYFLLGYSITTSVPLLPPIIYMSCLQHPLNTSHSDIISPPSLSSPPPYHKSPHRARCPLLQTLVAYTHLPPLTSYHPVYNPLPLPITLYSGVYCM